MIVRQIHYTSTESGLSNGKGFQIKAATRDIRDTLLREVERHSSYAPPFGAPLTPSSEELQGFPISFQSKFLSDGVLMVMSTEYIGRDYSGRFGNYFSHSLLIENTQDALGDHLPIELWKSRSFTNRETPETSLPSLRQIEPGAEISIRETRTFLQDAKRVELLASFLSAIEHAIWENQKLVIVAPSDEVAQWIAVASFLFPVDAVLNLSFNTYAANPLYSDHSVIGTTPDSDFTAASAGLRSSLVVFQAAKSEFHGAGDKTLFARLVANTWKGGNDEIALAFQGYTSQLEPAATREELAGAFAHYCSTCGVDLEPEFGEIAFRFAFQRKLRITPEVLFDVLVVNLAREPQTAARKLEEIYDYAKHQEFGAELQHALDQLVVPHILDGLAKTPDVRAVSPLIDVLARLDRRLDSGDEYANAWVSAIQANAQDVHTVIAVLNLCQVLGFSSASSRILEQVGELIVGPLSASDSLQDYLREIAGQDWALHLLRGLAAWLMSNVSDLTVFQDRAALLESKAVFGILEGFAERKGASLLYLRLASVSKDELRKGYVALCQRAGEIAGELSALELQLAFGALWSVNDPTWVEMQAVLEAPWVELMYETNIPHQIALRLATPAALESPEMSKPILTLLSDASFETALGVEGRAIVRALHWALSLGSTGCEDVFDRADSLKLPLEDLPDEVRELLRRLIARRLMEVRELHKHVSYAEKLLEQDGGLERAYLDECRRSIGRLPEISPVMIARVFALITQIGSRTGEGKESSFHALQQEFTEMTHRVSVADNRRILDMLSEFDPAMATAWESRSTGPKVRVREKSWRTRLPFLFILVFIVFLAIALVVISLRFYRPAPPPTDEPTQVSSLDSGEASGGSEPVPKNLRCTASDPSDTDRFGDSTASRAGFRKFVDDDTCSRLMKKRTSEIGLR